MQGIDLSDPRDLARTAGPLRELLTNWVSDEGWERIATAPAGSPLQAITPMVRALRSLNSPLDPTAVSKSDMIDLLSAAMAGHAVGAAQSITGYAAQRRTLKALSAAGQFDRFLDALFEVETAVYFRHSFPSDVWFEESAHPDLWIALATASTSTTHPCECKRIEPTDRVQEQQDSLAAALDQYLRADDSSGALVLLDLHCPASEINLDELLGHLAELKESTDSESWLTGSDPEGRYQLTVRPLGEYGQMKRRPIKVREVEPTGSMLVRAHTVYEGSSQDPVALSSLVRVRSDRLPDRVGSFERNLYKAMEQLRESQDQGVGMVSVRLRPPRGLGDLYEADRIVRRVLADHDSSHVGLVMLVWNESEEERANPDHETRDSLLAWHLKPHFVANSKSPVRFDALDSAETRFPPTPFEMLRDPGSGELVPIDLEFLGSKELAVLVPADEDVFTLYTALATPYDAGVKGPLPKHLVRGSRAITFSFIDDYRLRCLEIEAGHFTHVVTLDLRRWIGETEFLFWVRWVDDGFTVSMPTPSEDGTVVARSVRVRGVFI